MKKVLLPLVFLLILTGMTYAEEGPVSIQRNITTETYTFNEANLPILSYHFGVVPMPKGSTIHHFSKKDTPYDGAYYTDGSTFGGERSDYVQPIYGFNGEAMTDDYPSDHQHHRGCWWSWCEVRWNDKIGDIWAVNKIRAYPKSIGNFKMDADKAALSAVNVWRYDDDPTEVVQETVTITVSKTTGTEGVKSRTIDFNIKLEALVDGIAIAGRQKVDYGGYGGMAVRMVPAAIDFSIRVVHPKPDTWNGSNVKMAEVIVDPQKYGNASWLSIFGKYPLPGQTEPSAKEGVTTLTMFESMKNPLAPNNFRYYTSRNIMMAFPGFNILPLEKNKPIEYKCRFWLHQGMGDASMEKKAWEAYQKSL